MIDVSAVPPTPYEVIEKWAIHDRDMPTIPSPLRWIRAAERHFEAKLKESKTIWIDGWTADRRGRVRPIA